MTQSAVKPIPDCMNTLTAHLVCRGAIEAMEFYKKAFKATEVRRLIGPDGSFVHGELRIGNSMLMLAEENPTWGSLGPKTLNGSPVTIHLMVENVDDVVAQAEKAGAKVVMPPADMFWGDRYGRLKDPFGHNWSVATHIRDLTPTELQQAMIEAMRSPAGCPEQ